MEGIMGGRGKGFQEHLWRTHGQKQEGVESGMGEGEAWGVGGLVGEKWRQLYLNNNKKKQLKNKNEIKEFLNVNISLS